MEEIVASKAEYHRAERHRLVTRVSWAALVCLLVLTSCGANVDTQAPLASPTAASAIATTVPTATTSPAAPTAIVMPTALHVPPVKPTPPTAEQSETGQTASCMPTNLGDPELGDPSSFDLDGDGDDDAVVPARMVQAGPGSILELDVYEQHDGCNWRKIGTLLSGDQRDADHNIVSHRWSCTGGGFPRVLSQISAHTHDQTQTITNLTLQNSVVTTHQPTTVASLELIEEPAWNFFEGSCDGEWNTRQVDRCGGKRWTATLPDNWFTPIVGSWSCQVFSDFVEAVPCNCDRVHPVNIRWIPELDVPPSDFVGRATIDGYPAWVSEWQSLNQLAGKVTNTRRWAIDVGDGVVLVTANDAEWPSDRWDELSILVDELALSLELVGEPRPSEPFPQPPTSQQQVDSIDLVDFWNGFEYPLANAMVVENGAAAIGQMGEPEFERLAVVHVALGDLTGDGITDAAVYAVTSSGGSTVSPHVWVYELVDREASLVATMSVDELGDQQVAAIGAVDGQLAIDLVQGEPTCCSQTVQRRWYGLAGATLEVVASGPELRFVDLEKHAGQNEDLSPLPGTSTTVLKMAEVGGAHRFLVEGQAGQSVALVTSAEQAELQVVLLDPDSQHSFLEGGNPVSTTFASTGTHAITLSESSDARQRALVYLQLGDAPDLALLPPHAEQSTSNN